ncbi:unnamed protein product [Urochloa humidicola]
MVGRCGSLSSSAAGLGSSSAGPAARARQKARVRRSTGARRSGGGHGGAHAAELGLFISFGSSSSRGGLRYSGLPSVAARVGGGVGAGEAPRVTAGPLLHLLFCPHAASSSSRPRRSSGAVELPSAGTIGEKGRPGIECGRRSSRSWRPASSSPDRARPRLGSALPPPPVWIGARRGTREAARVVGPTGSRWYDALGRGHGRASGARAVGGEGMLWEALTVRFY